MSGSPVLEEEIRLFVPDNATLEAILADHRAASRCGVEDHSYRDRYLDHDFRLLSRRLALRLREASGQCRVELKGNGVLRDGVWCRPEWRQEAPAEWSGQVGELAAGPVQRLLTEIFRPDEPLQPLFSCVIARRVVVLALDDASGSEESGLVRLCLDRGAVQTGNRQRAICELELEGLSGARRSWQELATRLTARYGLSSAAHSKFRVGLSLLDAGLAERVGEEETARI